MGNAYANLMDSEEGQRRRPLGRVQELLVVQRREGVAVAVLFMRDVTTRKGHDGARGGYLAKAHEKRAGRRGARREAVAVRVREEHAHLRRQGVHDPRQHSGCVAADGLYAALLRQGAHPRA